MAELNARDTKLVQYLNEALTKEKQLEQALEAHIAMTTVTTYRKRLQQHLTETKRHAREVERRVKKLGGSSTGVVQEAAGLVQDVAAKGAALAQGPVHMVRGTSEQETLLKNARTEFKEEAEEIASYTAIQKLAESVGDKETAQLAKAILREEKRMAGFLEKLIPRLTQSVVQAEIPSRERNGGRKRTSSRRKTSSASRSRSTSGRTGTKRSTSARSGSGRKTTSRSRSASSGSSRKTTSRSRSASTRSRSASRKTTSARKTTRRPAARKTTRRTTARSR